MKIHEVKDTKRTYLDLLLLGDEDEKMIERYLDRGRLFVLDDGDVRAVCVVTDEGNGTLEIKNRYETVSSRTCPIRFQFFNYKLPTFLGNNKVSRIFCTPVIYIKIRSNPSPNPLCGTDPNFLVSKYSLYGSSGIFFFCIAATSLS